MVSENIRKSDHLADVPAEYVFYLNDGRILHNLIELRDIFNSMSDELYAFHVNSEKNDFCNWVNDIIHDVILAKDLRKVKTREAAGKKISQRVSYLQGRNNKQR